MRASLPAASTARQLQRLVTERHPGDSAGGGAGDDAYRWCEVAMDVHDCVVSITYFGSEAVESRNLARLVGLSEVMLNNVKASFRQGRSGAAAAVTRIPHARAGARGCCPPPRHLHSPIAPPPTCLHTHHTHAHPHPHNTRTHAHTHARTHAHAHARAHARTHARTHAQA